MIKYLLAAVFSLTSLAAVMAAGPSTPTAADCCGNGAPCCPGPCCQ